MTSPLSRPSLLGGVVVAAVFVAATADHPSAQQAVATATPVVALRPTAHDPVPTDLSGYWVTPAAPAAISPALRDFARAVQVIESSGDSATVLPLMASPALEKTALADYVRYYRGLAAQRAGRQDEAAQAFTAVVAGEPSAIRTQAAIRLAESRELQGKYAEAAAAYTMALGWKPPEVDRLTYRSAVALERAGDVAGAIAAHRRVYYDFPLSLDNASAGQALGRLDTSNAGFEGQMAKERARADALYTAKRWPQARGAYERVMAGTTGAEHEQAVVRIAAIDIQQKQYRSAVDRLRAVPAESPNQAEAWLHLALAARAQGHAEEFDQLVRQLASKYEKSPYTEEALNHLATFYIVNDDDGDAATVFGSMLASFPSGRFAERAAWKAGWWAYRRGAMNDAARYFEIGAANFPRSDFRPAWLYWSARAKDNAGDNAGATARYVLTATDYHNTYYGRLALSRLGDRRSLVPTSVAGKPVTSSPPPTQPVIATLLSLGLYDQVVAETEFARRTWGESPALLATAALAQHRAGRLRLGINIMKRAYPQYMAAGGEALPAEVLRVLFPLDHWPLIESAAKQRNLDPYLLAALIAQESNFDPAIRSSAGAIGLMQVMPDTGRTFARRLSIKPFSTRRLTEAEVSVAIGTQYLAEMLGQFGAPYYVLAGYNAGPNRVTRWTAERPGMPQDEWIDDIPFPETQNYVKRILGTAEDYRRLYGGGLLTPQSTSLVSPAAPSRPAAKVKPAAKPKAPTRPTPRRKRTE